MGLCFVYKMVTEKIEGVISAKDVLVYDREKQYDGAEITVTVGVDESLPYLKKGVRDES